MAKMIPTAVRNTPMSSLRTGISMNQVSKFPWLDKKYVDEIEKRTEWVPALYKDSMQQMMYSDYYQQQEIDRQQAERSGIKNQARQNAINASSKEEKEWINKEVKKADFADLIRRKYKINTNAWTDDRVIEEFVSQVPDWVKLYWQYINGENSDILSKSWLISPIFAQLNEKNKVKMGNNEVITPEDLGKTNLTSTSNFDNEEYAKNYIEQADSSYDAFIKQAKAQWFGDTEIASIIDANKQYQQYLQNVEDYNNRSLWDKVWVGWELPIWVAQGFSNFFINWYNNLLGENPYVWAFKPIEQFDASKWLATDYDPTGEMRANSRWTKWGDIAWKIWAWILTNQALMNLLPWMQAENLTAEWIKEIAKEWGTSAVKQALLDRTIQWAAEWGLEWYISSIWYEDPQETMKTTIPLWIWAWGLGWYLQWKSAINDAWVLKAADATDDLVKQTDEANKIWGRIGQGDIDDQNKVVEWVKSIRKRGWEDSINSIKTYRQLDNAIKKTEKQIIQEEDDLLRQYPDKIKDRTTTQTVKWLWDQTDDVTRDYLDEGIELLKKYNKNDPAALKELEMMQKVKNTEWLTRLEAKQLARKLSSKLSKKFYNSNDELRNSMSAESYEKIRSWIQNAVRDRLPDNTLKNLDLEYSNLKTFEDLTDDMTEKVNTLTQKLKEVWPIEEFGKKVGDGVNFVTGRGIKWLIEKFLPSNMWNKINNSIDMELELSKNLSKLLKLEDAIDVLNQTLSSSASQSVIRSAFNNFANTVTELQSIITPAVTIWANEALQ